MVKSDKLFLFFFFFSLLSAFVFFFPTASSEVSYQMVLETGSCKFAQLLHFDQLAYFGNGFVHVMLV